jgi:beta-galactosidase
MKLIGSIFLFVFILAACTQSGIKNSPEFEENGVEKLSLNGQWLFSVDSTLSENMEWYQPKYPANNWDTLTVPGNWDTENAYSNFVGTGYYRKEFKVPSNWESSIIRLCFGAVNQTSEVWLNGQYLGKHVGGYTPFEFDVTGIIQPGKNNTVALTANNEYQRGAWWHWGGISREVNLERNNHQQIVWQQITSEPDFENGSASVSVAVKIKNYSDQEFSGILKSFVENSPEGTTLNINAEKGITVDANSEKIEHITFNLQPEKVKLWDFENPNLYQMNTSIETTDSLTVHKIGNRFGIRKIETRGTKVLLNGKEIRLNGFNRVADHWAYGQTEPDNLVKFDIDAMKAMGCNFTRIMHHPQSKNLLDYCDEVGMLLIEEIPVWGKGDPQLQPDNPLTKQWLTEMITRDYNHPCIIGWSVANEIADEEQEGLKMSPRIYGYVETMIAHVKSLDSTRLKTYASFTVGGAGEKGIDPADLCDIICFNSYGGAEGIAEHCHKIWPDKPLFVSEIGKGQIGESLTESGLDESLKNSIKNLLKLDYVVGTSLWTYNDYRSNYWGTPVGQCRTWGVYNVWRQPKKAAKEIQQLYSSSAQFSPLPAMANVPDSISDIVPVIWAVVPLEKSCMVGFSVADILDNYEIEYKRENENPQTVQIEGLRGAAKVYNLNPGEYSFRIRRISDGVSGEWSAVYSERIY